MWGHPFRVTPTVSSPPPPSPTFWGADHSAASGECGACGDSGGGSPQVGAVGGVDMTLEGYIGDTGGTHWGATLGGGAWRTYWRHGGGHWGGILGGGGSTLSPPCRLPLHAGQQAEGQRHSNVLSQLVAHQRHLGGGGTRGGTAMGVSASPSPPPDPLPRPPYTSPGPGVTRRTRSCSNSSRSTELWKATAARGRRP